MEKLNYNEALRLGREALEMYNSAQTKETIKEIMISYGRQGIGWKPLCRILFSGKTPEEACRVYK